MRVGFALGFAGCVVGLACGGGEAGTTGPAGGSAGQAPMNVGGSSSGANAMAGIGNEAVAPGGNGSVGGSGVATGGSAAGGTGGAGGGGGANGGSGGSMNMKPPPTCTDATLRTGPPQGKEGLKTDPIDTKFPFSTHWVGRFSDDPTAVGITGLADFDHDGDLDFAAGQRGGPMKWWEYCSPDHWSLHSIGSGHNSPGGGNALDVDNDGWVDMIAGDSWYRNPQTPRMSNNWERHGVGVAGAEDVAVGDINGDGKQDAVWVWNQIDAQWRTPGADPKQPWPLGAAFQFRQTQGGFVGDIDGDKDNDVLVGKQYWYKNMDGKGTQWQTVNFQNDFDDSPLTTIGDIDGDGDMDFAMCTHFGARVAWFDNTKGDGSAMTMHVIGNNKNKLHAIFALDFDNDGDLDIYSGESTGTAWIWENTDGKGSFKEHAVSSTSRGHDARVDDIDCDGDLDIVGKPWGEGEPEPRDAIYLKNELVEKGGKAVFDRPKAEVWHPTEKRLYCP
jgi:hypothetical protein